METTCHRNLRRSTNWEAITQPTSPVVPVTEVRAWLRLNEDQDQEDAILQSIIDAANQSFEHKTSIVTLQKTIKCYYRDFSYVMELPRAPVTSISEVRYWEPNAGTITTMSASDYTLRHLPKRIGQLNFKSDYTFPTIDTNRLDPVEVDFIAGYGDSWTHIPKRIITALSYYVAIYYDFRTPVLGNTTMQHVPFTLASMLTDVAAHGIAQQDPL